MAKKRAEKTVNAKRPPLQAGPQTRPRGREYAVVLLLFLAVFVALCLLSYDPSDPSFNVATDKSAVSNLCGLVGSHVGDAFVQLLGISALLIPIVLCVTALRLHWRTSDAGGLSETLSVFCLLAAVCMLMERLVAAPVLGFALEHTGGALGSFLHYYLFQLLGSAGEMLFGITVILLCGLNMSRVSLRRLCRGIQNAAAAFTRYFRHIWAQRTERGSAAISLADGEMETDPGQIVQEPAWKPAMGSHQRATGHGTGAQDTRKTIARIPVVEPVDAGFEACDPFPSSLPFGEMNRSVHGGTASQWTSVSIPKSQFHCHEVAGHSARPGERPRQNRSVADPNSDGKSRRSKRFRDSKASDRERVPAGNATHGTLEKRVSRGNQHDTDITSVSTGVPFVDDYGMVQGDWLDSHENPALAIDDEFVDAKAGFQEEKEPAPVVGKHTDATEVAPSSVACQNLRGNVAPLADPIDHGAADDLPFIDWSGLDEAQCSEADNHTLDATAVVAEIEEVEPVRVSPRKDSYCSDPGVLVEMEDEWTVDASESVQTRENTPVGSDGHSGAWARQRGIRADEDSVSAEEFLPPIDWEEFENSSPPADRRESMAKHVQVSRRADEDIEASGAENALANGEGEDEYQLPPTDLLEPTPKSNRAVDEKLLQENAEILEQKLLDLKIEGKVVAVHPGPVITMYELALAPGIPLRKVMGTSDDLAMALKSGSTRVVAPIPGKDTVGIEVPNLNREIVYFREIIESRPFRQSDAPLKLVLGKGIDGEPFASSLAKMPHLLIAGATGTGKSVGLNCLICSWLMTCHPDDLKLLMVDPKKLELSYYQDVPHLIHPVVTEPEKVPAVLSWAIREMERRYDLLSEAGAKNIEGYNEKIVSGEPLDGPDGEPPTKLPYIVIIVDELAELMMVAAKDIEISIARLAQMARASGIHLILATQRPSVDVITGVIKANFPARLSYQVSARADSRTILDTTGAENLLGRGDMLFLPPGTAKLRRLHGAYISEKEIKRIADFIKAQRQPVYLKEITSHVNENGSGATASDLIDDEKYDQAVELVSRLGHASISLIQRHMRIGYNRAARIIEAMEAEGIIGPSDGTSRPREVLIGSLDHVPDQPAG